MAITTLIIRKILRVYYSAKLNNETKNKYVSKESDVCISAIGKLIDKLVSAGFLKYSKNVMDNRSKPVEITPNGETFYLLLKNLEGIDNGKNK